MRRTAENRLGSKWLTMQNTIHRTLRRYGLNSKTHLFGCTLLVVVFYRVWYTALTPDTSSEPSQLLSKRQAYSAESGKKAAYRYERYSNRNKENIGSPGEGGVGITLDGKDKALADSLFKKEAFNIIASNRIALNRTLKDIRDPA